MSLDVCDVYKKYGEKEILRGINLHFENGIYAILGPNGAGKSTLINIMVGIVAANSGDVKFNNIKTSICEKEYLNSLGFMPQNILYYKNFTAIEIMEYIGVLKGLTKAEAIRRGENLLRKVNLYDEKDKKVKNYSGGMKQRLGIAQALISNPKILIFDEPTAGLDPRERIRFRNVISNLSKDRIVVICTHIVSDIDSIADQVIMLKKGKIISKDTPEKLCRMLKGKLWNLTVDYDDLGVFMDKFNIFNISRIKDKYILRIFSDHKPWKKAVVTQATLEDVYLFYFNEEQRDVLSL
ncbi:MAG: ATP-binding cassette domain-containing protein [Anaerovoracaceae bacterium]